MDRVSINRRVLTCDSPEIEFSGESGINLSDTVFEFLSEDWVDRSSSPATAGNFNIDGDDIDADREKQNEDKDDDRSTTEEDDGFWETQQQLLQSVIRRTSSLESSIRSITKEAAKEAKQRENVCVCVAGKLNGGCRKCLMDVICRRLETAGFNSAICKSKWNSSPNIPSGSHTFLDVIEIRNNPRKGSQETRNRIIIELNFRGEFEMARANEEYSKLIATLPEIFVGKIERLQSLLKILCDATKKCMKEKKMHIAPWRKYRYMQAKWLRTCERSSTISSQRFELNHHRTNTNSHVLDGSRRSMLTVDLMMENYTGLYRPVEVL